MAERSARRRFPAPAPPASRIVLALVCAVWTAVLSVAGAAAALPGQGPGTGAASVAVPERVLPAPAVHTQAWIRVHAPARARADGYAGAAELAPAAPPRPGEALLPALVAAPSVGPVQEIASGRLPARPDHQRAPPGTAPGPWSARGPPPARSS
ncbi:hypothetical protein [Streptomyces sp. BBFR102]|uniref:hypothetical protein n=1 Tax=Streptomyces sp. BBFR102 TaxID=3448171 RepID=UPI003F53D3C5